ncbi:Uncharacterized protein LOK49_LG06G02827 [Camellia lanceoleosa]|uniref:Uncharacterized protein n=1 Tax=Camellia lanceoleosa TaxID=1840588 RepID=A0ACC0HHM7_9ERIC|nr:Uncharacterized protein LOK49_LG06G02827 [Camellia lanceoleosa]
MCPREPKQEFVTVKSSECKRRHRSSCCSKEGTNDDGDTALHDAVRYRQPDLVRLKPFKPRPLPQPFLRPKPDRVRLLIEEDPEFTYLANNAGESSLYIAAEGGYLEVMLLEPLNRLKQADAHLNMTQGLVVGEKLGVLPGMDSIFSALALQRLITSSVLGNLLDVVEEETVHEKSQKYKEGKSVLEPLVDNCFDESKKEIFAMKPTLE